MNNHLDHILNRIHNDHAVDAPDEVVRQAKGLFRTRPGKATASVFKRLVASLQADLMPNRPAFGERSAGTGQSRQLLFEAGDNAIDLRVSRTGSTVGLKGQILGDDVVGASVDLTGPMTKASAVDNAFGFEFAGIQPGEYTLVISTTDTEIVLEDLQLQ